MTALSFANELGHAISAGIHTPHESMEAPDHAFEALDISPAKNTFSDIRERRKLGRRIFKSTQPFLETSLRIESEISQKPYSSLQKQLESIIDASVDGKLRAAINQDQQDDDGQEDTIMVDAAHNGSEIGVDGSVSAEANQDEIDEDAMEAAGDGDEEEGGNIEVNTSGLGLVNGGGADVEMVQEDNKAGILTNGVSSDTPPASNGYVPLPRLAQANGPPTPPQSNGSLGKESWDPLTEGGVFWYLKSIQPQGTSVLGEHWAAGRDAVRMLSEDLTDMDDEELKGLGFDVDDTVTAVAMQSEDTTETPSSLPKGKVAKTKKRRTSTRRR